MLDSAAMITVHTPKRGVVEVSTVSSGLCTVLRWFRNLKWHGVTVCYWLVKDPITQGNTNCTYFNWSRKTTEVKSRIKSEIMLHMLWIFPRHFMWRLIKTVEIGGGVELKHSARLLWYLCPLLAKMLTFIDTCASRWSPLGWYGGSTEISTTGRTRSCLTTLDATSSWTHRMDWRLVATVATLHSSS